MRGDWPARWMLSLLLLGMNLTCSADPPPLADFSQAWRHSVETNDVEFIRQHWSRVGAVDQPSERGKTALMAAAARGDVSLAKALLDAGADVNAQNQTGGTPLIYASASGDAATVRLLLERGATVDHRSANGWTALMITVAKQHAPLITVLGSAGADVNLPDIYGWTPLMRAVYEGRRQEMEALLNQPSVALERTNDHGQTALHLAAIQGRVDMARRLLESGAVADDTDFSGNTPRSISLILGDTRMLAVLNRAERR
ncbi:MAG: ankyrin repeat domain-containing protein [Gammaproteobacteria bacterium]|nr:ankyrin repeat domain-containing protein [Gammaproteobacteria bacterium]MCP5425777.1 ankyrin repeat domain-containing protein [Gammaproteobacteria bacterium]MCP5458612.1 ankyrin repeat domain-containing protein [Gammaproteobacteria bacterium]